jgi:glycerol-1-phosphate dehydrogenase [NAD(P)+]
VSDSPSVVVDTLDDVRRLIAAAPEELRPLGLVEVVHGNGALRTLTSVLERLGAGGDSRVTVLSDATPKRYGNGDVLDIAREVLSSSRLSVVYVVPEGSNDLVLANTPTITASLAATRESRPEVLVSIGSGTLVDIGKVISRELSIPHVVVQTAASVNGFADDQSVLLIDGVKRTTPSQWPRALIIDPLVVAQAPRAMNRSGLGDELSMFSAGADWYLASAVGIDSSFSATITTLMRDGVDDVLRDADDLGYGGERAVTRLASLLTVSGLSMGVAGQTAPSSGSEHLVSHLLEMSADASGVASASHGSQVGVASALALLVWQRVRDHLRASRATLNLNHLAGKDQVIRAFSHLDDSGAAADECWRDYEKKTTWIRHHVSDIETTIASWPEHDLIVEDLLRPAVTVASALRRAQAPVTFAQLDPPPKPEVVSWAVANSHRMRNRFTIFDFAELLGLWGERDVDEVLAELQGLAP